MITDNKGRKESDVSDVINMYFRHVETQEIVCVTAAVLIKQESGWEWGLTYVVVDAINRRQKKEEYFTRPYDDFFAVVNYLPRFFQVSNVEDGMKITPFQRIEVHPDTILAIINTVTNAAISALGEAAPDKLSDAIVDKLRTSVTPINAHDHDARTSINRALKDYRGFNSVYEKQNDRTVVHITVGSDSWEPTPEELASISQQFINTLLDDNGGVVATRPGVNVTYFKVDGNPQVRSSAWSLREVGATKVELPLLMCMDLSEKEIDSIADLVCLGVGEYTLPSVYEKSDSKADMHTSNKDIKVINMRADRPIITYHISHKHKSMEQVREEVKAQMLNYNARLRSNREAN